ncbi:hypothetical protein [Vibrio sp. LaRot3]|uniref:hypothetical protein n=1 Tax=Vibrio sp. LaRot3 TaxID=2998829 RepID=UPI0022CE3444|nr:hypothetical protein [Vibrio sp. LaRot3]MDA0147736.1 hypothetical protein [Vibrio sp. LaRot3]
MLWETIERVNRLRQQALANPEYLKSAQAHQKALEMQDNQSGYTAKSRRGKATGEKKLADIYQQVEFSVNPSGREH